jgi:hypothetical protein
MSIYQRLESLSIKLPAVAPPVAAFVPFVRSGRLVFLSGHIAKKDGAPWVGRLGADIDVEQAQGPLLLARVVAARQDRRALLRRERTARSRARPLHERLSR